MTKPSDSRGRFSTVDGMIDEKIGEGGMGEVYSGRQVSVDRPVAIKILRPAMAVSEEYVSRFFREANLASQISHPNFVTIYDFGQAEGLQILYLAMEYLEGMDLADRMREGRMALNHIMQIASQCCAALGAAHRENIVHRDLKPENVFLLDHPGPDIQLKVLDFGIAKELGSTTSMTRTGQIFGTPEYMSPEQCQSRQEIDGRSDLYSLGCILYELISGRSPFQRETVIQTLLAQVSEECRDLRTFRFTVPDSTADIVMRLLEKEPADRFANAEEAKAAIDNEIAFLELRPDLLADYMESHRSTYEFDREVDSQAGTAGIDRHTSQLINLTTIDYEIEESASPKRSILPIIIVLFVLVGGGVAAAFAAGVIPLEKPEPEPPPVDLMPVVTAASETVESSRGIGIESVHAEIAEQRARAATILATSIAMLPPVEEPEPDKKKKRVRKKSSGALLGIRTPTSINRRAGKYTRKLIPCFEKREKMSDGGKVSVKFRIQPDGSVDSVQVTRMAFKSPAVKSCIIGKIKRWKFSPSSRGSGVDYHQRSFTFNPPK